jgi:predicted RecA/RadA family phage recombinase
MKNYIQKGDMITVAAPAGGVISGAGVLIGSLFGVAATTQAAGADVEIAAAGVFDLPKEATATSFAVGAPVQWDGANGRIAALSSGVRIGVVIAAAGATAATARVRLDG